MEDSGHSGSAAFLTSERRQLVDDPDSLRDATATDVPDAIAKNFTALRDDRIKIV